MKISTKGRYALVIMINLAKGYKENNYITLKEISNKENISLKYLEKIIVPLKKNNLVISSRGENGGYMLNKKPSEYKVGDIIRISEGDINITDCVSNGKCPLKQSCPTYSLWKGLNDTINNYLDTKTLEDLI